VIATFQTLGNRAKRFWRREDSLRARLVNISHLLTGNLFSSIIGMLGFIVTARALGPLDYGLLALTYSYTRAIERLVAFQSWQPLIKYGAELTGVEHLDDYRSLMKFGLLVDVSAAIAAYVVAVGVALLFGPLVGIGKDTLNQVLIYSTVLLFQINGLPTAVMRLAGRFRLLAYGSVIGGAVRLILCLIGLLAGSGLLYFIVAWTISQIVGALFLLAIAMIELRKQGVRQLLGAPLKGVRQRFEGLMAFTVGSNIELTIRSSANELDTLLVGALTDPTGAGLYHIGKRLGRIVLQIGAQVQAVLYPDVARLWAQGAAAMFRRAIIQTELILAAFGLAVVLMTWLFVEPVLYLTVGADFVAAGPLVVVQMIAVATMLSGSAIRTALLAMGKQISVLKVVFASTVAFYAVALSTIPLIGPMGANIANVVMGTFWLLGFIYIFHRTLAHEPPGAASPKEPPREAGEPV
jgi:O-antigen/teichoic acid export membrane protein